MTHVAEVAEEDAILDFLICWYLATRAEGRQRVMAALRRRTSTREPLEHGDGGARLWSWCTGVWLPGWLRAARMPEQARAVERGGGAVLPRVRQAAREAAMHRESGTASAVCTALDRVRAYAAVDSSGGPAVTCCGVRGDQMSLALSTARDAAYVALQDGADVGRVVARARCAALALVDGITTDQVRRGGRAGGASGAPAPMDVSRGEP